ncbi:MAG: hypothetical protein IJG68_04085 [Bacilli bacterium]|nr:hypothetical protein [Bacilli bacterium]
MNHNLENHELLKRIENNKKYIEEYVLDNNEGTKRMRQKFYINAAKERNSFIEKEITYFQKEQEEVKNEIEKRFQKLSNRSKSELFEKDLKKVEDAFELLKLSLETPTSFKLQLDYCIASIDNDIFLEDMNQELEKFINYFKKYGIDLTIEDFKYTMFTEKYMKAFFEKKDRKETFEKIYFSCPDIKLQLKLNLKNIIEKYNKQLNEYELKYKKEMYDKAGVTDESVVDYYISVRTKLGTEVAKDEYTNIMKFVKGELKIEDYLEDSPTRLKNYNLFTPNNNYEYYSEEEKEEFNSAIMDLYLNLNVLKKYYQYETILEDLIKRYKNKEANLTEYNTKKKELSNLEKNRQVLYKKYLKAMGQGFLAKYNEVKVKDTELKMNELIKTINETYNQLNNLEITNSLSKLNDSSSITDLLKVSLLSFAYLETQLENNEAFKDYTLKDIIDEYYRFIYNPNNQFMRKINVLTDYNIANIVAEKFRLLKLNITDDQINKNNLEDTLDTIKYINTIQNIDSSKTNFKEILEYCEMNTILENYSKKSE